MRKFLLAVLVLLHPALALAQTPATPAGTSTPAATASPDSALDRRNQVPQVGGEVYEKAVTFEAGAQIGKTADGASDLTFVKRVKATVNPVAVGGPGASTTVRVAATGAVAGDFVKCTLPLASASGVVVKSEATGTDFVDIELVGIHDVFVDVGAVAIQCLVVR